MDKNVRRLAIFAVMERNWMMNEFGVNDYWDKKFTSILTDLGCTVSFDDDKMKVIAPKDGR